MLITSPPTTRTTPEAAIDVMAPLWSYPYYVDKISSPLV